jgi:hypothetical protein
MSPSAHIEEKFHSILRGSWESYLANQQFISNLLIPMPNHIMESHIKSHVCSFLYYRKKLKDYVRLESFTKQTIPNGLHKALPYPKRTNRFD